MIKLFHEALHVKELMLFFFFGVGGFFFLGWGGVGGEFDKHRFA
jgi:hypothetical protein